MESRNRACVVSIFFLLYSVAACNRGESSKEISLSKADGVIASLAGNRQGALPSIGMTVEEAADAEIIRICGAALDAVVSCAGAHTCDQDISAYLPAANRSALIGLESLASYSSEAFDRYCLTACQNKQADVDETRFAKDVCGTVVAPKRSGNASAQSVQALQVGQFLLHGKLKIGVDGIMLAELLKTLGPPEKKHDTHHDCGSAFDEGNIKEYVYPDFTVETDGDKAVLRSIKLQEDNTLLLANGQSIKSLDLAVFQQMFGADVPLFGEAYRIGTASDGSIESAFDFHFDLAGRLAQADYWIAC